MKNSLRNFAPKGCVILKVSVSSHQDGCKMYEHIYAVPLGGRIVERFYEEVVVRRLSADTFTGYTDYNSLEDYSLCLPRGSRVYDTDKRVWQSCQGF